MKTVALLTLGVGLFCMVGLSFAEDSFVLSKEFYERRCAGCHKMDGSGDFKTPPIDHYPSWTTFARAMDRCPIAPELNDTEIELVSRYVVSLSRRH